MAITLEIRKKYDWIDWMKALGIYLVILGHFFSVGEEFIYVFHVPLFFLVAGLLSPLVKVIIFRIPQKSAYTLLCSVGKYDFLLSRTR